MHTTRIDQKLSAMELHKALVYAYGAFQEYLGLLHAVALYNCVDEANFVQHSLQVPMIFRATETFPVSQDYLLKASKGCLICLDLLGIESDVYFRASDFYLLNPSDGLAMLPLKLLRMELALGCDDVMFYAIKIATPPDSHDIPSYDDMPFRNRPINDVRRIKTPDEIPDDFVVAPEIIVSSNSYFSWLHTLDEILCYRLTPLQPLFPMPISTPYFTQGNVTFPNGDVIYLPKLNDFKEEFAENKLPQFSDIAKPLLAYESHTKMMLALIAQEVNRRLAREHVKNEPSKTTATMSFDSQATPRASERKVIVGISDEITFPKLMEQFESQGWVKDRSWYKRVLKRAGVSELLIKGSKGAILYPSTAAKAAITDAITAEKGKKAKKSQF